MMTRQNEIIEFNPLDLQITKSVVGQLETNIDQLEQYVNNKLAEYSPELYNGDADAAKKDRAELNNSREFIAKKRIAIIDELMKPYNDFELRCKALESKIDQASKELDKIVKLKEEQEKSAKRKRCDEIWSEKNFTLFPIDKVFDKKWLNKTKKESEISSEMDAIIAQVYKDLKTIERYGTDAETLKAHYLDTLDIGETLDYGEELEKNRKKIAEEAALREQREREWHIEQQKQAVQKEAKSFGKKSYLSGLASEALGVRDEYKPLLKEYVVTIKATDDAMLKLKSAMNTLRIEYSVEELVF